MNVNMLIKSCGFTVILASSLALSANMAHAASNQAYIRTSAGGITEIIVDNSVVNGMLSGQLPERSASQPRGAELLVEDVVNYNGIVRARGMQQINGQIVLVNPVSNGQMMAMVNKPSSSRVN